VIESLKFDYGKQLLKPIRQAPVDVFIDINIIWAAFNFDMSLKINLFLKRFVNYILSPYT